MKMKSIDKFPQKEHMDLLMIDFVVRYSERIDRKDINTCIEPYDLSLKTQTNNVL